MKISDKTRAICLHSLLVISMIVMAFVFVGPTAKKEVQSKAEAWTQDLQPVYSDQMAGFEKIQATDLERERLVSQFNLIKNRAENHRIITGYFFARYYMAITELLVFGAISAIALFFITKSGFSDANPYVITIFITATSISTFFGAFPGVFRQSENIADNKELYLRYIALENEMLSYSATGLAASGKKIEASAYIIEVDKKMSALNNLAIGFDSSKIPAYSFQES